MAELRREIRRVYLSDGTRVGLGVLAGTVTAHPHLPDGWTGSTCMICFGWSSDFRHLGHRVLDVPAVIG